MTWKYIKSKTVTDERLGKGIPIKEEYMIFFDDSNLNFKLVSVSHLLTSKHCEGKDKVETYKEECNDIKQLIDKDYALEKEGVKYMENGIK